MSEGGLLQQAFKNLAEQVDDRLLIGARDILELLFVAYACQGHVLIEGPPGCGKTRAAKLVAQAFGKAFKRIQFTSDLLPSDMIGANVYSPKTETFTFVRGPLFAEIVVADELNRAPPRTQSALLEAMEERQVTVEGTVYPLAQRFFLVATQNPLEAEGTFPLPEAQMDRFLMRLKVKHGSRQVDERILQLDLEGKLALEATPLQPIELDWHAAQQEIAATRVDKTLLTYIARLLKGTRQHKGLAWGASIRSGLGLSRAARVLARLAGRDFVVPDDIKKLVAPIVAHRVKTAIEAQMARQGEEDILLEILAAVPFPSG